MSLVLSDITGNQSPEHLFTLKHGAPKALVATACKIARIVYHMLKDKREYVDSGATAYEDKYKEQVLKNLKRKAKEL